MVGHVLWKRLRYAHSEPTQRSLREHSRFDEPSEKRLKRPIGLVLEARAAILQSCKELTHGKRRHMRDLADQSPHPPRIDAERGLSASGHALAQQERVYSFAKGVSLCFFGGF